MHSPAGVFTALSTRTDGFLTVQFPLVVVEFQLGLLCQVWELVDALCSEGSRLLVLYVAYVETILDGRVANTSSIDEITLDPV